eukprot:365761-Chlamydomonas_euryale.AAC.4
MLQGQDELRHARCWKDQQQDIRLRRPPTHSTHRKNQHGVVLDKHIRLPTQTRQSKAISCRAADGRVYIATRGRQVSTVQRSLGAHTLLLHVAQNCRST